MKLYRMDSTFGNPINCINHAQQINSRLNMSAGA